MLIIDSREKEGSRLVKLVEGKARKLNIKTEKKWLEIGDYVYDNVCFEAKSVEDFIGSVMSKRTLKKHITSKIKINHAKK